VTDCKRRQAPDSIQHLLLRLLLPPLLLMLMPLPSRSVRMPKRRCKNPAATVASV
jgi:hypothetical protein